MLPGKLARVAWSALAIGALLTFGSTAQAQQPYGPRYPQPIGTLGLTGNAMSGTTGYVLYNNGMWMGMPNWRNQYSGRSFIASPYGAYSAGYWRYDPRWHSMNLYNSNGVPLTSLYGYRYGYRGVQFGVVDGYGGRSWTYFP
jgi:hypothetical protein